jgi:DNA-binding NarL/FixJ family response regulator
VELFDHVPDEIQLVLLDLNMPVLDGAETAVELRARKPDVPILIMSGIADEDALGRFGQVRIAGFVPKPFAPDQLAQAIAIVRQGTGRWAGKDRRGTDRSADGASERRSARTPAQEPERMKVN